MIPFNAQTVTMPLSEPMVMYLPSLEKSKDEMSHMLFTSAAISPVPISTT